MNLNPKVALHSIIMALKPGMFFNNLWKKLPSVSINQIKSDQSITREPDRGDRTRHTSKSRGMRERYPKCPKYHIYTPLAINRAKILEEAHNTDILTRPPQSKSLESADHSKYCSRYHKNHGHTTKGCTALRDQIKELV
ncbi:hypothetical protein CR513_58400, partial [Mucuna pruriens]